MYYDITRAELLKLITDYEIDNTLQSLATKSGVTYQSLLDFKRGKSVMLRDKNLRPILEILAPSLLSSNSTSSSISTVPVIGFIKSGGIVKMYEQGVEELERVECPKNLDPAKAKAYRYTLSGIEFLIFIEQVADGISMPGVPPEFIGHFCIVTIDNNGTEEILFKKVMAGSKPGHYDLYSIDNDAEVLKDCLVKFSLFVETMQQTRNK